MAGGFKRSTAPAMATALRSLVPLASRRRTVAKAVRAVFEKTPGIVDVDDSSIAAAPKKLLLVDRRKAAMLGVPGA